MFGLTEILHVVEALAPAEQRAHGDDENVDERVLRGARHARIGEVLEVLDQTEFGMRLHPLSFRHLFQKYQANFAWLLHQNLDASALSRLFSQAPPSATVTS